MSLSDKVAVVTGSSSGIGAAIAIKFAEEGAQVVITGRNETKLENVSKLCVNVGKAPFVIVGDISKEEIAKKLIDETVQTFGKIDILVNNAGIFRVTKVLDGKMLATYDEIMKTNMRPVVHLTSLVAPHIVESKGNIINISSGAGKKAVLGMTCYGLSKAAMDHFTRGVALELSSSGVRVNTISPGPVETDIAENAKMTAEEVKEINVYAIPLNRISAAEEVADLALFLASDKAVGITGADFVLDNGVLLA